MNIDSVREFCLSFPYATEQVTWGSDLTFRVGGKIFANLVLEPAPVWLSFKCSPENFVELTERAGIIPAPYLARAQWVALQTREALPSQELQSLLRESYEMVFGKLTNKVRKALAPSRASVSATAKTKRKTRKSARKPDSQRKKNRK